MISDKIFKQIKSKKGVQVFCAKDFAKFGSRNTADKILSRLSSKDNITRISRGIYYLPTIKKDIGSIPPDINLVARAIARNSGNSIYPSGSLAANMLGLSDQVPAKNTYWTDGKSRIKRIGNNVIYFKHSNIKPLSKTPQIVILILNSLSYLGKNHINDTIIKKCSQCLNDVDKKHLLKMSGRVKGWIADYIHQIIAV